MNPSTQPSILFVDDDKNLLAALGRQLRRNYSFETANGPEEALARYAAGERFAVVVSDYTMPGMTGVELLHRVATMDPDAVRLLLTGNADLALAIEAVNKGRIFRLLVKPCAQDELRGSLDAALEQHLLRCAERDILERTLGGCVQLVADIVSHLCPNAFGRAMRLQTYVRQVGKLARYPQLWHLETAALLSQLGVVALPPELLARGSRRQQLGSEELAVFDAHPIVAGKLLRHIPRLELVAEIIARQAPASSSPKALLSPSSPESELPAAILAACIAFDELISQGVAAEAAAKSCAAAPGVPASLTSAILALRPTTTGSTSQIVPVQRLHAGMILDQDVRRRDGQLVITRGHEITPTLLERLLNYVSLGQLTGTVQVITSIGPTNPSDRTPSIRDTHPAGAPR